MANYQKLYAYLVGQVDDALQYLADAAAHGKYDREHMLHIGLMLKNMLMTVEDMYLDEKEL